MSKADKLRIMQYVEHILEAMERIYRYTKELSENEFLENELIQDAVIRNIEIMGEAAKNIERHHPEFADQYLEIPWSDIYLMRNRVSHGYFAVDLEIVWHTLQKDLPELDQQLRKIYNKIGHLQNHSEERSLSTIAEVRDTKKAKRIKHKDAWK